MTLIIVDPRAKGTVNVISPRPLDNDVLYAPVRPGGHQKLTAAVLEQEDASVSQTL